MRFLARISLLLLISALPAVAGNSVVNLSHYDLMRVDFEGMKRDGIVGVIHEATYPRFDRIPIMAPSAATRAGLLWGAYRFRRRPDLPGGAFYRRRESELADRPSTERRPFVLDFEKNGHIPERCVGQAAKFVGGSKQTGKYPGIWRVLAPRRPECARRSHDSALGNCWLWIANHR
jgi:hypothetical protein